MTRFTKILIIFLVTLAGTVFLCPNTTYAAANMKISPVANGITIKPGDVQNYQFTMENLGQEQLKFKLSVSPYNVINENYDVDFVTETSYNQIVRWVTFQDDSGSFVKNPTLTLAPGEKRTVVYRVSVPDDIPKGGQYCIIFAESVHDETDQDNMTLGLQSVTRVSLIILGHGEGDTRNTAEITDFSLTGMFTSHNIDASARVKNTGNTDFTAIYDFTVKSIFGRTLYTKSDNFAVLPQTERRYSTSWAEAPLFGLFSVTYKVTAVDVDKEETHIIMILPAFVIVIALLLLTSIVVWSIILLRKRKERSSRHVV